MLFNNPSLVLTSLQSGSEKALSLSLKLWSIYAMWMGLLQIIEDSGLDKKIARKMDKLIDFLMGKCTPEAKQQIALNITSNIFGMGNACTPSGIKGMAGLSTGSKYITNGMAMFFILNVTSLQIVPTTIISLRLTHNSLNAGDIILPTIIATIASTMLGILLIKLCGKLFKDKPAKCDYSRGKLWAPISFQL